ncbi:MAG: YHS domain-containing protein [Rhodospirillales bacterium]|nr:YHS domain-containing protein [Rhodospirillales bacterium]
MIRTLRLFAGLVLIISGLVVGAAAPAGAQAINATRGIAIQGFDPVAYFTDGKPARGSSEFKFAWNGAEWRFASAQHRDLFAANPEKYAPQYGGFCAYGVSQGVKVGFDPAAWRIVDGKLYLNLNPNVQSIWVQDIPGYNKKADENWPKLGGVK